MAISVVAGLASLAGAALGGLVGSFAVGLGYFALGAGMSLVSRALAPKPDFGAQMRGIQQTSRTPAATRKIIYGQMRVGGQVVFIGNSGDDNAYLHLAIAFATHEIQSFDRLYFNEDQVWSSSGGVASGWTDVLDVYTHDGSQTTADANLVNDCLEWTNDHKLLCIAYVHVKIKWDADFFPNGVPNVTALLKGKKVYDPRTSTTVYSDNPALCLRDYLTSEYGLNEAASVIDDTAVTTAANLCDESVSINGGSQKRYRANGQLDTGNNIKGNIEQLLACFGATLVFVSGKYVMRGAAYVTPSVTFTEADFVGDIQVKTKQSRRTQYNTVKGIFVSSEENWKVADYPAQTLKTNAGSFVTGDTYEILFVGTTDFTAIGASSNNVGVQFTATGAGSGTGYASKSIVDDGAKIALDMPLPFVTHQQQAQRLAKIALNKSRQQVNLSGTVNLKGLQIKIGDTVYIDNDRLGYDDKVFEVIDFALRVEAGGESVVDLQLIETSASVYDWTTADEEDFLEAGELDLHDGKTVPEVSNMAITEVGLVGPDATLITSVRLTWDLPTYAFIGDIIVRWKKSTDSAYAEYVSLGPEATEFFIQGLDPDYDYDFAIQVINLVGVHSDATLLEDQALNGDTTAPALPTQVSALGDYEGIILTWLNPSDVDFKHVEIFAKDTNSTPAVGDTPTAIVSDEQYLDLNLEGGTTRYFWLRSVDYSDNKSAFTTVVSAIASSIKIKNLGLLLNQNAYPTDLPAPQIKSGEEYEIQTVGTSDFTDFGASANTVGTTFTATRDGDNDDGTGTVEHTSYESNSGELAIVGLNLDGTLRYGEDGSIVWNGEAIDVPHDGHNDFTALTNLSGKQGWIAFDRNKTAPFDMSGVLPSLNVGFVHYEDGQWYYDDDSATAVSFNPDSFTGTTTGTDGTTTARLVALGTLKTGSSADSIAEGGLFSDPLDLRTVELPENFVDVTKIATQLESDNYSADSAGWKIERSGDVEFNNITARGEIHANSGTIATGVTIGGTAIGDIESMVNGSLALYVNKDAGQTANNGEGALVGVDRDGTPVDDSDGFIVWNGSKITIEHDQLASTASFATQVANQRGFIAFDVNKSDPFDITTSGVESIDVAFVYKIDDQWYYDDNTTATATSGQTFDPENTSGAEFVALGWLETGSSDVIKYAGLYGQPVALTLAAFPSDALESGTIGGISISNDKLYEGVGTFKNANTGFYLDSDGDFSLTDKLYFDNSAAELVVDGTVRADVLDIVGGTVAGNFTANNIADGSVFADSLTEDAHAEIEGRLFTVTTSFNFSSGASFTPSNGLNSLVAPTSGTYTHVAGKDVRFEFLFNAAWDSWGTSYTFDTNDDKATVKFEHKKSGLSTWTTVHTATITATKADTPDGHVFTVNERETYTLTGLAAGDYQFRVTIQSQTTGVNYWSLAEPEVQTFYFNLYEVDTRGLTLTDTLTASSGLVANGLTYPTADGTNGQVITTNGSGTLSFTTVSGGGGDADTLDGLNSTQFLRSDTSDTFSGTLTGDVVELSGGVTYDPSGGGTGTDTATDVGIALTSGTRIVGTQSGYIRNLFEWNNGSDITIGQGGTSLIQGINLLAGSSGDAKVDGNRILTVADEGAGNGLDADTVDGQQLSAFTLDNVCDRGTSTNQSITVGGITTGGQIVAGSGSGGVSLTHNDGYGNANVNFNHRAGNPEQNGQSARIVVNTDSTTGGGSIQFKVSSSAVTANTPVSLPTGMTLYSTAVDIPVSLRHAADTDTYLRFDDNRVRLVAGGTTKFDSNNSYWHSGNDGSGSGLDADTVDGIQASSFLRSDAADTAGGTITFNAGIALGASQYINHNQTPSRDKIRVWNNSSYAIGMDNAMLYGHLGDYAMTFQMNDDAQHNRGWVFLDTGHSDSQGAMSLTTDGRMTLASSLSVGEGESITSPSSDTLHVEGSASISASSASLTIDNYAGSPNQTLLNFQADMGTNDRGFQIKSPTTDSSSAPFRFTTGNAFAFELDGIDALTIASTKRVGIGNSSPDKLLCLKGDGAELVIDDTQTVDRPRLRFRSNGSTTGSIFTDGSGVVKIDAGSTTIFEGTASEVQISEETYLGATLDVRINSSATTSIFEGNSTNFILRNRGTGNLSFQMGSGNTQRMYLQPDGDLYIDGTYNTFSDERLKDNIQPIENALDKVDALNGVTFNISETGRASTGLIAQDVEQVLSEAVQTSEDGYKTVAYGNTVGLLVEAIKELRQEVADLKKQLQEK